MTVEMEQPFVWPEIPNLEAWGKQERQKEEKEAVASNSAPDANDQRQSARELRKQVEMLLKKEEPLDEAIQKKKAAGIVLTADESKRAETKAKREAQLAAMSRLQLWEDKRTGKVVEGDDRSKYTIKA
jgi:large subunit ribosomal protein L23